MYHPLCFGGGLCCKISSASTVLVGQSLLPFLNQNGGWTYWMMMMMMMMMMMIQIQTPLFPKKMLATLNPPTETQEWWLFQDGLPEFWAYPEKKNKKKHSPCCVGLVFCLQKYQMVVPLVDLSGGTWRSRTWHPKEGAKKTRIPEVLPIRSLYGGLLKMVGFPNKLMGFPTKNDHHLGCLGGTTI